MIGLKLSREELDTPCVSGPLRIWATRMRRIPAASPMPEELPPWPTPGLTRCGEQLCRTNELMREAGQRGNVAS